MAATQRLALFDLSTSDGAALADHLEDAFGAYRRPGAVHFSLPNSQAFSEPFIEALATLTGRKKEQAEAAAFPLLEGAGNMLTRLVDGLYALAQTAKGTSVEALLAFRDTDAGERPEDSPDAERSRKELERILALYGDRSGLGMGSQPALHVPTWREKPELIFPMIAPYLQEGREAPQALRALMNEERDRQAHALVQTSQDEEAARVFQRWLALMRRARTDLENHNHYIDQMSVGQLRAALLAAGRWLEERDLLAEREDIFWLHREEITRALRADPPASCSHVVAQRRIQWEEWEQMAPPPLLGVPDCRLEPRPPLEDDVPSEAASGEGVLRGTGASAGRIRGRARVVPAGTPQPNIAPGEILIAEHAGAAWTPLFPALAGIVLTRAALFHHAATTAREYGLPAVINVRDATSRIPAGAWSTLDGTTGEILIEEEEARPAAQ